MTLDKKSGDHYIYEDFACFCDQQRYFRLERIASAESHTHTKLFKQTCYILFKTESYH